MTKYWIGVISADHVALGVQNGFMQIGHGKRIGVSRQQKGDWIIFYSSKATMDSKEPLQEFTALGQITDIEPYQGLRPDGFKPWRRNVDFETVKPLPIRPILGELSFIKDKIHWGVAFRYGLLEIPEKDFKFLADLLAVN